jgi:perosamine synthetase
VAMAQAEEVLIDNAVNSPNICLNKMQKSSASIAIIPHMFGLPNEIKNIKDVSIIEDCAQSIGSSIGGVKTGLFGKVGVFSFYATKLMTSGGQGGMLVSKDKELVDRVRDYRDFDCRRDKKHRFNFQMTDLQASIGRVQLNKLPNFIARRKEIFSMYSDADFDLIEDKNNTTVYYRAIIRVDNSAEIKEKLLKQGVKVIVPIEDWELLGNGLEYQNAYNLTQTTLSLPIYPSLTNQEVENIIKLLNGLVK